MINKAKIKLDKYINQLDKNEISARERWYVTNKIEDGAMMCGYYARRCEAKYIRYILYGNKNNTTEELAGNGDQNIKTRFGGTFIPLSEDRGFSTWRQS